MIKKVLNKNNLLLVAIVILLAVLLFQGLQQIYHQDEYRWIEQANDSSNISPHPPMTLFLLKITGSLFGYDWLRVLPAFFGILNLILVYLVSKRLSADRSLALLAAFLFAFNAYSLIAGLQIDADGAIMPFLVLASYYAYLRLGDNKKVWLPIFSIALIGGFLTKLTFTLFVGALALDYYFDGKNEKRLQLKKSALAIALVAAIFGFVAALFYFLSPAHFQIVAANFERLHLDFGSRAYLDLVFKILKSLVLLSPLLFLSILYALVRPDLRRKYSLLLTYLFFNFIFYAVIFDFSTLTIERYFMFMIAPAAIIGAEVLYPFFARLKNKKSCLLAVGATVVLFVLSVLTLLSRHDILPLNPKIAYLQHLQSLNLKFLIPFTGGSGPIGFYFSAMFVLWFWLIMLVAFVGYLFWSSKKGVFLNLIFILGLVYNAIFMVEFLWGRFYGSVPKLARQTVDYVNADPKVKQVITYYDIAPYDLRLSGKYYSRFYTAPTRDYTPKITNFRGHYMIVNFPEIGADSPYWKLIQRCPVQKELQDKSIKSYVFDCTKLR